MRTVIKNTLCSLLFLGILIGMLALLSVLFRMAITRSWNQS